MHAISYGHRILITWCDAYHTFTCPFFKINIFNFLIASGIFNLLLRNSVKNIKGKGHEGFTM